MTYIYKVLDSPRDQIRLLTLHVPPQDESELIQGTLDTCSIEECKSQYEALSYTWGERETLNPPIISLDGCPLAVTPNLALALRYLRPLYGSRRLWVDAICIDQSNVNEKNEQIQRMRDIFAGASKVLIWLGEPQPDVESAMDYMTKRTKGAEDGNPEWPESEDEPEFVSILPGLQKLFDNTWWHRMWTAQELVVAENPLLVCGHSQLPWHMVSSFMIYLMLMVGNTSIAVDANMELRYNIHLVRQMWHDKGDDPEKKVVKDEMLRLENLFIATSERDAFNPRDQVFAVLGMLPPGSSTFIPDYDEPVSSIYQKAMVEILRTSGDVSFLQHAVPRKGDNKNDLPSWCLDFSVPGWNSYRHAFRTFLLRRRNRDLQRPIRLDPTIPFKVDFDPSRSVITVVGYIIGKVFVSHRASPRRVHEWVPPKATYATYLRTARASTDNEDRASKAVEALHSILEDYSDFWLQMGLALDVRLGTKKAGELLRDGVVWRAFAGGDLKPSRKVSDALEKEPNRPPSYSTLVLQWVNKYMEDVVGENEGDQASEEEETQKALWNYSDELFTIMAFELFGIAASAVGTTFFGTRGESILSRDAYIGRADYIVELNDIVCVLNGCNRPAVLRPCEDGTYKLISFAYVHDVLEESDTALDLSKCERHCLELS